MPVQKTFAHTFDNGLVLVAEEMDWLESAAFALLLPAGSSSEPAHQPGLASLTCEMAQRGCGSRDSRQFVADLENLGADVSASVSNAHTSFGGAMPAESLDQVLPIYADLVQRPHLPEDQLEDARQSCLQEILSLEDDLAQKMMLELRKQFYPEPFGRSSLGTAESVAALTIADVKRFHAGAYRPNGAILSVAGKIDWPRLKDLVGKHFGGWKKQAEPKIVPSVQQPSYTHVPVESAQVHIGVGFDGVSYAHPDYFQLRGAMGVLSDGMSSRLFTEVREKRGLVYTVYASCHSLRDRGGVFAYAGTTAERAQETLNVLIEEVKRLYDGVEADELKRLKSRIKRALILQQESSPSRSGSIAYDWYYLGRIRPMQELRELIDGLNAPGMNDWLSAHRPKAFTTVTLGPQPLEIPQ
jgi:predicted Zn-dependent peptidase